MPSGTIVVVCQSVSKVQWKESIQSTRYTRDATAAGNFESAKRGAPGFHRTKLATTLEQEVDNAVNNTLKEVSTRYDFRGLHTEVRYSKKDNRIELVAAEGMKIKHLNLPVPLQFVNMK